MGTQYRRAKLEYKHERSPAGNFSVTPNLPERLLPLSGANVPLTANVTSV